MGRKRRSKRRGQSTRKKERSLARGVFEANPKGYGFITTPEGEFFIPESKTRDAMDGDLVEVMPIHVKRRQSSSDAGAKGSGAADAKHARMRREEARIVRVIDRKHDTLIGRYEIAEPFGVVVPEDPRIKHDVFTLRSDAPDVPDGAMVKVRILEYPTRRSAATGVIEKVYGDAREADLAVERVIALHALATEFPEDALSEADVRVDADAALRDGYRDLRERFMFTIDPADAKDFDDALSIDETEPGVWRLGVHIADVSAYVGWGSSVDLEARRRGTSVYLPDRVLPMLPSALSERACSLQPGEDRLCMTADLYVDAHAKLLRYELYPAVMRSEARLTYDEALSILNAASQCGEAGSGDGGEVHLSSNASLPCRLRCCSALAKARARWRMSQGGIEFSTKEAKVVLDDAGKPIDISVRKKNDATELIEEAMIFANEVVATHLFQHAMPCAYRDHESPSSESMAALVSVLQEFKWFKSSDSSALVTANPHAIQDVLERVQGRLEEDMVVMLMLRAMMRATYSPRNLGHYGLGLGCYCHFTSPIRRYPDLMVHRMLKYSLGFEQADFDEQCASLAWLCEHSSAMERKAEAASLDAQKAKMAEYMHSRIGEEFDAIVSGVMSYGLYVRLDNCIEGLIPIRTLDTEYFVYDEQRMSLRGADTNTVYRLGQKLHVKLIAVDTLLARIDFALA